jgi:hypothetical protein
MRCVVVKPFCGKRTRRAQPAAARTFTSQDGAFALGRRALVPPRWPFAAAASMM